jgi:hypothetical protein
MVVNSHVGVALIFTTVASCELTVPGKMSKEFLLSYPEILAKILHEILFKKRVMKDQKQHFQTEQQLLVREIVATPYRKHNII